MTRQLSQVIKFVLGIDFAHVPLQAGSMDKGQLIKDNAGVEFNAMARGRGAAKAELKIENEQMVTFWRTKATQAQTRSSSIKVNQGSRGTRRMEPIGQMRQIWDETEEDFGQDKQDLAAGTDARGNENQPIKANQGSGLGCSDGKFRAASGTPATTRNNAGGGQMTVESTSIKANQGSSEAAQDIQPATFWYDHGVVPNWVVFVSPISSNAPA